MGAMNSCFIPRHGSELGTRHSSTPKDKGHRRNLSATFNLSVIGNASVESCLVNINVASEEELMTLPGVNRTIAKNIIDYRNHIGGFRRVEDLALASGVGAAKLALMCNEIYVESSALDEKDADEENASSQQEKVTGSDSSVCINSANIFSLLRVKGIGMTIAKNIVAYREKHGKYTAVDDLSKVKGIGHNNLEIMRPYLTVEDKHQDISKTGSDKNCNFVNSKTGKKETEQENSVREYIRRSASSLENLLEILGPLAKVPERPKLEKVTLTYKNRQVFRLASWNLEKFSLEKARNPGVKDVVCMTILENGFGLVAVQELEDKDALLEICRELNTPTLPNVKKWTGTRGHWACVVSEVPSSADQGRKHQGFLYDKFQNIELVKSCPLECAAVTDKARIPFLGLFKIKEGIDFTLISVHFKASDCASKDLKKEEEDRNMIYGIIKEVRQQVTGTKDIVILGDFHVSPDTKAFNDLCSEGYIHCISPEMLTSVKKNSVNCGNIWISKEVHNVYTGVSGVVTEGLSSSWIPCGWSWGGAVSKSCPVYAQLYSSKDFNIENMQATPPH